MANIIEFHITDQAITHLNSVVASIKDNYISQQYIGFISSTAVTSYEVAIKKIFINFGNETNIILGEFTKSYFSKINGRIKKNNIEGYIKMFGDNYFKDFKTKIQNRENDLLRTARKSMISSYNNIIEWRHQFVHEGIIPSTVTYEEAVESYHFGKEFIKCLEETMI